MVGLFFSNVATGRSRKGVVLMYEITSHRTAKNVLGTVASVRLP
jgi:hypothetical protein